MKKIAVLLLSFVLGFACMACGADENADNVTSVPVVGASFEELPVYATTKPTDKMPFTIESWVKLEGTNDNSPIYGNVNMKETNAFSFRVNDGMPTLRLSILAESITFENSKLPIGEWVHLAMAVDMEGKQFHCYINGVLSESKTLTDDHIKAINEIEFIEKVYSNLSMLGGYLSLKHVVREPFYGEIASFAAYSDTRTAEEIALDYKSYKNPDQDDLMMAYVFEESGHAIYQDLSANNRDLSWGGYGFLTEEDLTVNPTAPDTYDYSIMVIGDTQILTQHLTDGNNEAQVKAYNTMFDWVAANIESKKMKMVIGVGDITHNNIAEEWETAKAAFEKVDNKITHLPILGNHDVTTARGGNDAKLFAKYLKQYETNQDIVMHDGNMKTYYYPFELEGHKYLFLGLGYEATQEEVDWAKNVIEDNSDRNVILCTHAYLDHEGTAPVEESGAKKVRNQLVLTYPNIVLVLCGHRYDNEAVVFTETRTDGTKAQVLLTNPQKFNGYLYFGIATGLYFNNGGKTVHIANHVTGVPAEQNVYLGWKEAENVNSAHFKFELDLID